MKVGYIRFSKNDLNGSRQLDMLTQAGCQRIFIDNVAGAKKEYPGLEATLNYLQAGDTLIVWRLERLGRSFKHLVDTVNHLAEQRIGFQSLQESIDTTAADGQRVIQTFAALAEFQRNTMRERTKAGLEAARARGRQGGRPKALDTENKDKLFKLYDERQYSVREICKIMGISSTTLYAYLKER
jgi:DNA invertase Pin-like site-specific DNA recombinase